METGVPGESPDDELQKMPHTIARKFKPQTRSDPHSSIGGRLGKHSCKPLRHASPLALVAG